MSNLIRRPATYAVLAAIFLAAGLLVGCSGAIWDTLVPANRAAVEQVRADNEAAAGAAEEGNLLRTVLFSLAGAAGAIGVAVRRQRRYDDAPYEGEVGGRKVTATEAEIVKGVEALRAEGKIS